MSNWYVHQAYTNELAVRTRKHRWAEWFTNQFCVDIGLDIVTILVWGRPMGIVGRLFCPGRRSCLEASRCFLTIAVYPIIQLGNHVASAVWTFAALVALSGVIAALAAHRYGGRSHAKRRIIFTLVGAVGMLAAAALAFMRL